MTFTLTIDMAGAAFDEHYYDELSRILKSLGDDFYAGTVAASDETGRIHDFNGNTVGAWSITND